MRIPSIISAFAIGLIAAYLEGNLIAAYITVFATMILISLRRIQGEIEHYRGPMSVIGTETQIALQMISQVYRMVAPTIQPSEMFAGDRLHEKQEIRSL
jgi:hypothetical protein